jgi:hypothetical protein
LAYAQVAILCNHQRSVPKGHMGQMQKMEAKLMEQQDQLDALQRELTAAEKGKAFEGGKPRAPDACAPSLLSCPSDMLFHAPAALQAGNGLRVCWHGARMWEVGLHDGC